ncbi:MAG TPA: c-type cytochrome [Flavobacteriaceae bacterium]|nr:c-type cytochrome [Flavobacteriaceae bacterium]
MKRAIFIIVAIVALVIICSASYLKLGLPNVQDSSYVKVELTSERIQHGAYLANHVTVCMDCHSTRDWKQFAGPVIPGTLGKGGEYFGQEVGFPGKFYARNLTPFNLGDWTDGEIYRAITTGVDKDGEALFPVMPYLFYGKMDKDDIYDIIAYLRTLPPIENTVPEHEIDFPMNFIINTIPTEAMPLERPEKSNTVEYGKYLVNAASCMECHSKADKGEIIMETAFAGGREFKMPNGIVRSANITPDKETGLGFWTEAAFVNRFKSYNDPKNFPQMKENQVNTIMPWTMFAGMDTTDLKAIYSYIKTLKPIKNKVEHFSLASK